MDQFESKAAFGSARKLFRASAGDLFFPTYFLPREKRRAVDAVAAFCAMIVEALDLPEHSLAGARAMREHPVVRTSVPLQQLPPENAGAGAGDACEGDTTDTRLAMLRERIDEIYDDRLELPAPKSRSPQQDALLALSIAVKNFPVDRKLFMDFASGDSVQRASSLGVMISSVLGVQHSEGRRHAIALASGIFLARNRSDVDRARQLLKEGADGICWLADDGSRLAVAMATVTSAVSLRRKLTATQKLRALPIALKLARRLDGEALPKF